MIQDIAPRRFDNQYRPAPPKHGDYVFFYQGDQTLIDQETGLPFAWEKVSALPQESLGEMTYLFSIDQIGFHWANAVPCQVLERSTSVPSGAFRTLEPGWMAFAGITAHHLHTWYRNHQFCGRCGQPNQPHQKERAMVCPACGTLVYPTISPAVIVAVTHGDRLLLTKYANRAATKNYALIAGFAEIGEPLEETVRREVMEEVGLKVKNIRFYKSQPWGFSSSLLSGFYCDLDGEEEQITLEEEELGEATWFQRDHLPQGGSAISLTHEMIERFRMGYPFGQENDTSSVER